MSSVATRRSASSRRRPTTRVPWQVKYLMLALIWGSSFLLMKVGLRTMAPLQISGLRIFAGTATLLSLLAVTGGRLPREPRVWGHLAVSGVFLTALPFSLFAAGEERVSSALAGIGNATTPLAAVFFALALLPSDRLSPRKLAAVIIGFVGVVVIMQPWASAGRPDLLGFGMTLVAGACYGLGWTYNRRYLGQADLGGLSMPTALLVVGSVLMVPVVLVWWLLHRSAYAAPWSGHPDTGQGGVLLPAGVRARPRRRGHRPGLHAAVRRGPRCGCHGEHDRHLPHPGGVGHPRRAGPRTSAWPGRSCSAR